MDIPDQFADDPKWSEGTRSTPEASGVIGKDGWSGDGNAGFKIGWLITTNTDIFIEGKYTLHYKYTITGATADLMAKELSHIVFQVTDGALAAVPANFANFKMTYKDDNYTTPTPSFGNYDINNGNPLWPVGEFDVYGMKFDVPDEDMYDATKLTIEFDTWRAPAWVNFYAKDGVDGGVQAVAYNTGFQLYGDPPIVDLLQPTYSPDNTGMFIAGPNTSDIGAVPLPGAVFLLGAGLARLMAYKRRLSK